MIMDTQRLHKLADHLDRVRPEAFSIRVIVGDKPEPYDATGGGCEHPNPTSLPFWLINGDHEQRLIAVLDELQGRTHTCQTVACAAGHAVGAFPADLTIGIQGVVMPIRDTSIITMSSLQTMVQFFNLTKDQMSWIFSEHSYPFKKVRILPKHVAERIRRLLICKGDLEKALRSEPRALVPEHFKASC